MSAPGRSPGRRRQAMAAQPMPAGASSRRPGVPHAKARYTGAGAGSRHRRASEEERVTSLRFVLRPESFCIHRLPARQRIDLARLDAAGWYSVTRTSDEISVVAPEGVDPGPGDREP